MHAMMCYAWHGHTLCIMGRIMDSLKKGKWCETFVFLFLLALNPVEQTLELLVIEILRCRRKRYIYMGHVTELRLSCYLVLLSIDSKTR